MSISLKMQWHCPYFSFTTSFQKVLPQVYKDKAISTLWSVNLNVLLIFSESLILPPLGLFLFFLFLGEKKPTQTWNQQSNQIKAKQNKYVSPHALTPKKP